MKSVTSIVVLVVLVLTLVLAGCKKEQPSHVHNASEAGHEPAKEGGHHGKMLELGSGNAGPFAVQVAREVGALKAGGEAGIDISVKSGPKVSAVRIWIGLADAKGSIKALAELEDPSQPNHWHSHAEIPSPLPAGSKLWVEVEGEGAAKGAASFELKM